ncbi:MAG: hypothetical protein V1698_00870 [bacterium]
MKYGVKGIERDNFCRKSQGKFICFADGNFAICKFCFMSLIQGQKERCFYFENERCTNSSAKISASSVSQEEKI